MLELLALLVIAGVVLFAHVRARKFVRGRLRYTGWVDRPLGMGALAGAATALVAAPLVGFLPLVGGGTALLLGAGVGTGVALGARDSRAPAA